MNTNDTTQPNLKVTVAITRNMFHKSKGTYTAKLGETGWQAESPTKNGALQLLQWELERARQNEFRRFYARANGATFCLYWAGGGWAYDIVRDDEPNRSSTNMFAQDTSFEGCKAKMLVHVAQWSDCQPSVVAA